MYEGLLSVKNLCFYALWLNHCQIFGVTYSLAWMFILDSPFCCFQVLHRYYFIRIALFFHIQYCSLICKTLFQLCHYFFYFYSFLVCWIQNIVLAIVVDWIVIPDIYFFGFNPRILIHEIYFFGFNPNLK